MLRKKERTNEKDSKKYKKHMQKKKTRLNEKNV